MPMISSPVMLWLLASVALAIAFFAIGEMIDQRYPRRPLRMPTEGERLAQAMRHMPRASREGSRNSRVAGVTRRIAPR